MRKYQKTIGSFGKFMQRRYLHAIKYQPKLLAEKDLNINPLHLSPFLQTFLSRKLDSRQVMNTYHFQDYQKVTPANIALAFYRQVYSTLHKQEYEKNINEVKSLLSIISQDDINCFIYGVNQVRASQSCSQQIPFTIKRLEKENIEQDYRFYQKYMTQFFNYLKSPQYKRIRVESDGSISYVKKKVKLNYEAKKQYFETSFLSLVRNHFWRLLLDNKVQYNNGTKLKLTNCGYLGTYIFSGQEDFEQFLYLIFVEDIKFNSHQNYHRLIRYLNQKFYDPENRNTPQINARLRKEWNQEQAFWRKVLKKYPVPLQLKLKFLGIEIDNLTNQQKSEIEKIQSQDPLENLDLDIFQSQIKEVKEARKMQSIVEKQDEKSSQKIQVTLQKNTQKLEEDAYKNSVSYLLQKLVLFRWRKVKDIDPKTQIVKLMSELKRLNLVLFCVTHNIPGRCELVKDQWKVTKKFDLYKKIQ